KELLSCPHGNICDVIGLVVFSGRHERIRSKVSVVVCTRLQLVRASSCCYLTNTTYTQIYCTGSGHHSVMPYRKLRPVRQFVRWLQSVDDRQVLSRAVVGEPGLLRGAELKWEAERLQYRERRSFCIQATITMVTHCRRGEEDQCLVWTDRPAAASPRISPSSPRISPSSPRISPSSPRISPSSPRISPSSPRISPSSPRISPSSPVLPPPSSSPRLPPYSPTPSSACLPPSSPRLPRSSPGSSVKLSPRLLVLRAGLGLDNEGSLWEASMEFLETNDDEHDEDDDEDDQAFLTAPSSPVSLSGGCRLGLAHVAMETLPLQYCPATREEQAVAVEMQTGEFQNLQCCRSLENYSPSVSYTQTGHYTLTLRADLIATASQLANQRLLCVLEVCLLGGDRVEVVLSRAFPLKD
ncbi:unnamed protein product, partial [Coregonus sp. 'balchen']